MSDEIEDIKVNKPWQFQPGQSGNPNGRPPGAKSFTTKVREALEKIAEGKNYTYEEAFIKSILKKGIVDGDPSIIRLMWNYFDGMPRQTIGLDGGEENKPIPILHLLHNDENALLHHNGDQEDTSTQEENQSDTGGNISE